MFEFLGRLADKSDFMPHGYCFIWDKKLLWMHVGSDILTGLAYYLITGLLLYFIFKRRDIPFNWLFILFGAFIFLCGTTHFMTAWTVYVPSYYEEGAIKAVNALVSAATAIILIPLMPKLLVLPSLQKTQEQLKEESKMRKVMMDNLPCIALILKKNTREIVASNKTARDVGAIPGKTCFETCAKDEMPCSFCKAPVLWETDKPQHIEVKHKGTYYEGIWVPYSDDLYVHYIFDISDRKKAEKELNVRNKELEKLNRAFVGRELKMAELKKEMEELKKRVNS